jgi:hypothetical protein
MDEGQIVVDAITRIRLKDITYDLAREAGFASVKDLRRVGRANMMATPRAFRPTHPPQKM